MTDLEREAFELWVRNHFKYPNLDIDPRYPGFYADKMTAGAWEAWQARAQAQQWRPIETAPTDGTSILLWAEVDGGDIGCGFTAVRAEWSEGEDEGEGENDMFGSEGGWLVSFTRGRNICSAERATGWMPLPAGPEVKHD